MHGQSDIEKRFFKILEERGSEIAKEAKKMLLEEVRSVDLRKPLKYALKNWRGTYRPTLISLSCEAVGGQPEVTVSTAKAMTLIGLSLNIYNNMMDNSRFQSFRATLPEKFGEGMTLLIGGIVTAKAFSILCTLGEELQLKKCRAINSIFQEFLLKMAEAEAINLRLKMKNKIPIENKFKVLQMQAASIEACTRIGAILGSGTESEIEHLGRYGQFLGIISELKEDLMKSLNLTLELVDKIRLGRWPYALVWASRHSKEYQNFLHSLKGKEEITPNNVKRVVEELFKAGASDYFKQLSTELKEGAINELSKIRESKARNTLTLLIEAQQEMLIDLI